MPSFPDWLAQQLHDRRISKAAFSRGIGVSAQMVGKYLAGSTPSADKVGAIASTLGVGESEVLAALNGSVEDVNPGGSDTDSSPDGAETGDPLSPALDELDPMLPAPPGHTRVMEILIEPSASEVWDVGTEEEVVPEQAPSNTIFPDWYIRSEYGVSPDRIRFARVRGDSMEPTIRPGQRLVVALLPEGSTLRDSTIYLIHGPGGAQVKRLLIEPDHIHVWSDNPDRPRFKVKLETFERDYRVVAVVLETNNKL